MFSYLHDVSLSCSLIWLGPITGLAALLQPFLDFIFPPSNTAILSVVGELEAFGEPALLFKPMQMHGAVAGDSKHSVR